MTKRDRIWLKAICKEYKVKYNLIRHQDFSGGMAAPHKGEIWIEAKLKGDMFKSVVLHEIVHCLNFRNKKYLTYHINPTNSKRSLKYLKRMALRAEVYTEIQAKKMSKRYGVKNYWRHYYFNKRCRKLLKDYYGWK